MKELLKLLVLGRVSTDISKMKPDGSFLESYPSINLASLHWRFELMGAGDDKSIDSAFDTCLANIVGMQKEISPDIPVANLVARTNGQQVIRCKKLMFEPVSPSKTSKLNRN